VKPLGVLAGAADFFSVIIFPALQKTNALSFTLPDLAPIQRSSPKIQSKKRGQEHHCPASSIEMSIESQTVSRS
jgi:hypothetical protein